MNLNFPYDSFLCRSKNNSQSTQDTARCPLIRVLGVCYIIHEVEPLLSGCCQDTYMWAADVLSGSDIWEERTYHPSLVVCNCKPYILQQNSRFPGDIKGYKCKGLVLCYLSLAEERQIWSINGKGIITFPQLPMFLLPLHICKWKTNLKLFAFTNLYSPINAVHENQWY